MFTKYDEDILKYGSIAPHLRRDILKFKDEQAKWINRLYKRSCKMPLKLTKKQENDVLDILEQMIRDDICCVRTVSVQTMANIAGTSESFVTKCVDRGILKKLLNGFLSCGDSSRKAVLSILGSYAKVCKPEDLEVLVELSIVEFIIACFTSTDDTLIAGAAYATSEMVRHSRIIVELVTKGLLRLTALLMLDDLRPSKPRTRALLTLLLRLSERRGNTLAHAIRHSGCVAAAGRLFYSSDRSMQRLVLGVIMNIGMVSVDYIAPLFSPNFISDVVSFLIVSDDELRYYAGNIIRKIAESSKPRLCIMMENGLLEAVLLGVQVMRYCADTALPALAAVLRRSPNSVVQRFFDLKGHCIIGNLLHHNCCDVVYVTIFYIFLDIHKRGIPYNTTIANTNIYPRLTEMYKNPSTTDIIRSIITNMMAFVRDSTDWKIVWQFFFQSLHRHTKFAMKLISEVLAKNKQERICFMEAGGLSKLQELIIEYNDPMNEYARRILSYYPRDVLNYYKPDFIYSAMYRLDKHNPEETIKKFHRRRLSAENANTSIEPQNHASFTG